MNRGTTIHSLLYRGLVKLVLLGAALVLLLSGLGAPSQTDDVEPSLLPLGWWKLDETDGATAADAGWAGHPLALESEGKWAPGKLAGALVFDGRRDFLSADTDLFEVRESFTLGAWVNVAAPSLRPHPAILGKSGAYALGLFGTTTRPAMRLRLSGRAEDYLLCSAEAPLELQSWHHIAATYSAAERGARLYVDGLEACAVRTKGEDARIARSEAPLEIGRWAESRSYFPGQVDDARIYDRALTSSEIAEVASSESDPAPAAPTDLTAAPDGEDSITLSWNDEASTESGFVVERKSADSKGRYSPLLYVDRDDRTLIDRDLRRGATYVYRMRSYSPDGFSAYSKEAGASLSEPAEELPLGWWKLDDGHGAVAADEGRGGHDGVLHGETRWIDGADAGALELDGLDSYVEVGSPPEYGLDRALTLSAWVNVSATAPVPNPTLLGKAGAFVLGLEGETTRPRIEIETSDAGKHSSASCASLHPLETGWHHLAVVYDRPELGLIVDGVEVCRTKTANAARPRASEAPLLFGFGPNRAFFKGALDDIRLYDRSLGPEEVFALAVAPSVVMRGPGSVSSVLAAAAPTLQTAEPDVALAGGGASTVTLTGVNFPNDSRARLSGTSLTTTFVSALELRAEIPASLLTIAGEFPLDVVSASKGISNAVSFGVLDPSGSKASFQDGVSPTTQYAGTRDTYINAGSNSTNYGSATSLWAHGSPDRAPMLQWDLGPATVPPGSSVLSAWLTLYVDNTSPNRYPIYQMKRSWVESRATWNRYDSGKSWQTPGALGTNDRGPAILGVVSALGTGRHTYPLNAEGVALVQSWVDGTASNHGVLIQNYVNSNTLALASSEGSQSSRRPRFTVFYNQAPQATNQTVTTAEDVPLAIRLGASDAEGEPLTYVVVTEPEHGGVVGAGPEVTYVPLTNYNGPDRFTFRVNDGRADSNVATVSITVTAVVDPVAVSDMTVSVSEDTAATFLLTASGGEGPVAFTVLTSTREGILSGNPPELTYGPGPDFKGIDSFTFKASDGLTESGVGTVYLAVNSKNDPPVAQEQRVVTERDTPVPITLRAVDPDGLVVDFPIDVPPQHGTLSCPGPGGECLYSPEQGFAGIDSFTFKASDGTLESAPATVTLVVGHPAPYRVIDLGTLGGENSSATGINADSQVVGRADLSSSSTVFHPFLLTPVDTNGDGLLDRWYQEDTASGANALMRDLMPGDPSSGVAEGINVRSDVVGSLSGAGFGGDGRAFRWRDGFLERLYLGVARDVHPNGVVGARRPSALAPAKAVVYDPETDRFVELGLGSAEAINDDGRVVGYTITSSDQGARAIAFRFFDSDRDFTLDPGELELLGGPVGFVGSAAHDVNAAGEIAGSAAVSLGATRAYRVTPSPAGPVWTDLGTLGGGGLSQALAVNAQSQIVGLDVLPRPVRAGSRQHAFLWESGVLRDLNFLIDPSAGLELLLAADINDRGEIVGEAFNGEGQRRAVVLLPEPLPSRAPQAVIQANPLSVETFIEVQFDGRASSDPDPEDQGALRFAWDFGDGETASGSTATHFFAEPGTYRVVLWVIDTWNVQSAAQVLIDVTSPPEPPAAPMAVISAQPSSGPTPLTVTFDGSGSTSGEPIVSYEWTFGDGTSGAGAIVQHTYLASGTYTVTLVVQDTNELVATSTTLISAGPSESGVWTWGWNGNGQLGDGTTADRHLPIRVPGLNGVTAVAAGGGHTLSLKNDGTVWAWGWNEYGQVGDGTSTDRSSPVQVMLAPGQPLTSVTAIDAGQYFSLALRSDGSVWLWGANVTDIHLTPVQIGVPYPVTKISAGYGHSLAIANDGSVFAWGEGSGGQLGTGDTGSYPNPVQVPLNFTDVTAVEGGLFHSLALRSDGTVWVWGVSNELRYDPFAVQVPGLDGVTALAAGELYSVALGSDGNAWAWGVNYDGRLGDGTTSTRQTPVPVATGFPLAGVDAFFRHTVARAKDGRPLAWGHNDQGQLGDGTTTDRTTPVAVGTLSGATQIRSGLVHSVAITVGPPLVLPPVIEEITVTPSDAQGNGLGYVNLPAGGATTFTFEATASDPNGDVLTYQWDFNADALPDCVSSICQRVYLAPGRYTALLTVTDSIGLWASRELHVNVHDYAPPEASLLFQADGLTVLFDGSNSKTFAGAGGGHEGIVRYTWTFGDGTGETASLPEVEHRYPQPGTYLAVLEVENAAGLTDQAQATVSVDYPDDLFDKFGPNDTRETADPILPVPNVVDPDKGYRLPVEGKTVVSYKNYDLVLKAGNEDWYEVAIPADGEHELEVSASFTSLLDGTPGSGAPDLQLYDASGTLVASAANGVFDVRDLAAGTYALRVSGFGPTAVPSSGIAAVEAESGEGPGPAETPLSDAISAPVDSTGGFPPPLVAVSSTGKGPQEPSVGALAQSTPVLWDQFGDPADWEMISQDFLPTFGNPNVDVFDNMLADDFEVPAGTQWLIHTYEIAAEFNPPDGSGLSGIDLRIFKNDPVLNRPGVLKCHWQNVSPTIDGNGVFRISGFPCFLNEPGRYWFSPEANAFWPPTAWYWQQKATQVGYMAKWKNPKNGYGTGCVDWTDVKTCSSSAYPDQLFRLLGTSSRSGIYVLGLRWLQAALPIGSSVTASVGKPVRIPLLARTRFGEMLTPDEYDAVILEPAAATGTPSKAALAASPSFTRATPLGTISYDAATETLLYVPTAAGLDRIVFAAALPNGFQGSGRGTISITSEPHYEITEIGPPPAIPGGEILRIRLNDVNKQEQVVGEMDVRSDGFPILSFSGAFVWQSGDYVFLEDSLENDLDYNFDSAFSINDGGQVGGLVSSVTDPKSTFGVVADPDGDTYRVLPVGYFVNWSPLPLFDGRVLGINNRGWVVGGATGSMLGITPFFIEPRFGQTEELQWHAEGDLFDNWRRANPWMTSLAGLSPNGQAEDINDRFTVVGTMFVGANELSRATRWKSVPGSLPEALPGLGAPTEASAAHAVNSDGAAVGESGLDSGATHATLWEPGETPALDLGTLDPGANFSVANDVNDRREVVGASEVPGNRVRAFLWAHGQMFDLNETIPEGSGWTLTEATAINNEGTIVGQGFRFGQQRGFILKPAAFPIRVHDANYRTAWNASVDVALNADPADDSYEFLILRAPQRGTLTKHPSKNNQFRYTPEPKDEPPGLPIVDQFTYVVTDASGNLNSSIATVRIMELSYQIIEISPPSGMEQDLEAVIPRAINNQGEVVGRLSTFGVPAFDGGFHWQDGQMTLLQNLRGCPARIFDPSDNNEQGRIIGNLKDFGSVLTSKNLECEGFLPENSEAFGINAANDLVGNLLTMTMELPAFRWDYDATPGQELEILGGLGGPSAAGRAINDGGWVVGEGTDRFLRKRAFLVKAGLGRPLLDLETLGGRESEAKDVSNESNGKFYVVGWAQTDRNVGPDFAPGRPARWVCSGCNENWPEGLGRVEDLGSITGDATHVGKAKAVNQRGMVVGTSQVASPAELPGNYRAFLWMEGGFMLDLLQAVDGEHGWSLLDDAVSINDEGWIVGIGEREGKPVPIRGFLMRPGYQPRDKFEVNLKIDSDNTGSAEGGPAEEQIEDDPSQPGKFVFVNNADKNNNEIPGYADRDPVEGLYVPLVVEVEGPGPIDLDSTRINFSYLGAVDLPSFAPGPLRNGFYNYSPAKGIGFLRVWKHRNQVRDSANYVRPLGTYSLNELGFQLVSPEKATATLYVEGVRGSGRQEIGGVLFTGASQATDKVGVTVLEPTLGVNNSNDPESFMRPGIPDVEFEINVTDHIVKDQRDGFAFWYARPAVIHGSQVGKEDLVDFFPVSVNVPPQLTAAFEKLVLYWELEVESDPERDVQTVIYPAASGADNRRKFLQDYGAARAQLAAIDEADSTPGLNFLRSSELLPLGSVSAGRNEFLAAVTLPGLAPPERKMRLKLVVGKPPLSFGEGQVIDSVRITVRNVEQFWTLASARGEPNVDYQYPLDKGVPLPLRVYPSPGGGQGISGKDPTEDPGKTKFVIMVHGMWTPVDAMLGTYNNVFKRLYWLGYRGNFVGFDWDSDELGLDLLGANSENAMLTSPGFLTFLNETVLDRWSAEPEDIDVIPFSLGNLVVMDALRIAAYKKEKFGEPSKVIHNVIQTFAGTWAEAYDPREPVSYTGLSGHEITYSPEMAEQHSWHHWFRQEGRPIKGDGGVLTGDLYHAYNPLDSILIDGSLLDFVRNGCLVPVLDGRSCAPLPWVPNPRYHYHRENFTPGAAQGKEVVRGPFQGSQGERYLNSLGSLPSLLALRDQRRPDYAIFEVGYLAGITALDFADHNYDAYFNSPTADIPSHSGFIWDPLPSVYWLYEDLFAGRRVGGAPSIPIGVE